VLWGRGGASPSCQPGPTEGTAAAVTDTGTGSGAGGPPRGGGPLRGGRSSGASAAAGRLGCGAGRPAGSGGAFSTALLLMLLVEELLGQRTAEGCSVPGGDARGTLTPGLDRVERSLAAPSEPACSPFQCTNPPVEVMRLAGKNRAAGTSGTL